jgi:hypothetical protein
MQQFLQFVTDVYLRLNMFRASSCHYQELNNCSSSLWFYLRSVGIAVLLVVVGPAGRPGRPDHDQRALLSPRSEGKTRGCYCSC